MRYATVDGQALRALRRKRTNPTLEHDLSLKAVAALIADELGVPQVHVTTLSKVETLQRQPSEELLDAWCKVLNGDRDKLVRINVPPELANHIRNAVTSALPIASPAGAA